ncbi:hypothetical protein [Chitinivibrio alkaliphilus]|uniref:Uncharacterized protein n=1 Tax=Chitinivibrio alkaliphilus ACht1 TaxID=1313304 RepID=U7D6N4_9BACT|nr:hypothetical protein [Chitinivibrio alkaliphilus]ERP32179.1 hypothetical protein CALK_0909 [Chitinivibrio alkaliphilus ACht1]
MDKIKNELIRKARDRYENIFPCGGTQNLLECFTIENGQMYFWFNTPDNSTHALYTDLA